jgi:ABC-type multidrug transport system fused ATPase/permease subunit
MSSVPGLVLCLQLQELKESEGEEKQSECEDTEEDEESEDEQQTGKFGTNSKDEKKAMGGKEECEKHDQDVEVIDSDTCSSYNHLENPESAPNSWRDPNNIIPDWNSEDDKELAKKQQDMETSDESEDQSEEAEGEEPRIEKVQKDEKDEKDDEKEGAEATRKTMQDAVSEELARWRADDRPALMGTGQSDVALRFARLVAVDLSADRGGRVIRYPDIAINQGDSIALTGPSGVGKTTLLRLLAGLEVPQSGEIKVDDTRLDTRSADAWRTGVGWMPQAPHFLNQSLRHNLAFGASPDPRILTQAHLDNVIASLPQGDLTTLGESGAGLSGGEARRVMLARALSGGPSLLLADEPTADLDGDTAKIIIEGLLAYTAKGGTLVAATHDPRLIGALGRCIQLEVTL